MERNFMVMFSPHHSTWSHHVPVGHHQRKESFHQGPHSNFNPLPQQEVEVDLETSSVRLTVPIHTTETFTLETSHILLAFKAA